MHMNIPTGLESLRCAIRRGATMGPGWTKPPLPNKPRQLEMAPKKAISKHDFGMGQWQTIENKNGWRWWRLVNTFFKAVRNCGTTVSSFTLDDSEFDSKTIQRPVTGRFQIQALLADSQCKEDRLWGGICLKNSSRATRAQNMYTIWKSHCLQVSNFTFVTIFKRIDHCLDYTPWPMVFKKFQPQNAGAATDPVEVQYATSSAVQIILILGNARRVAL